LMKNIAVIAVCGVEDGLRCPVLYTWLDQLVSWLDQISWDQIQISQSQHSVTCLQPYLAKAEAWRNGAEI